MFTRSGETWTQQGAKLTGGGEIGKGALRRQRRALLRRQHRADRRPRRRHQRRRGVGVHALAGNWTQQGEKLTGLIEREAAQFGIDTAISADGKTALVGGRNENGERGAVWVFVRSGAGWNHQAKLTGGAEVNWRGSFL